MLQLHDRMKADASFQATCEQERVDFPSGSTWIAFTDEVSHAAMAGQYQFEQTFLLPVSAMIDESRSPLRVLERIKGGRSPDKADASPQRSILSARIVRFGLESRKQRWNEATYVDRERTRCSTIGRVAPP